MPVKVKSTPMLPGLSPVGGKAMVARFDAACPLSSDGGLLALREVEQRLAPGSRVWRPASATRVILAGWFIRPGRVIRARMLMINYGYEDGNDATLRRDPMFKLAMGRFSAGRDLCSQSTISRLENLPDARALLRMGRAMVDLLRIVPQVPKRIVLDIDDTFDAVHGGQQLRLFNAHYDDYGFQPIVVFDGDGRLSPPCCARPVGRGADQGLLRRLIAPFAAIGPGRDPAARRQPLSSRRCSTAAAHGSTASSAWRPPRLCGASRRAGAEHGRALRGRPNGGKVRRFKDSSMPPSWSRVERIVARVEAGPREPIPGSSSPASPRQRPLGVPGPLLRARSGRKPHQSLEDPSRCRPHFLSQGQGQPVSSVPARRRLLAAVELRALMPKRSVWRVVQLTPCGYA